MACIEEECETRSECAVHTSSSVATARGVAKSSFD